MTDKQAMLLAEREMRRLHTLLGTIRVSGPYYSNDESKPLPHAEWAKEQLEKFHRALTTGVVFAESTQQHEQLTKKNE